MNKLGIVFAGQGSQFIGMGLDFAAFNHQTNKMLDRATQLLDFDIEALLTSENGEMHQTIYTQPLMFLATVFAYEELKTLTHAIEGVCGFSLGEYSAYYAAHVFTYEDLLHIVKKRAVLMHQETLRHPGKMAAIIGLESHIVSETCQAIKDGIVVAANYNSNVQTVISGEEQAVLQAIEQLKEKGAKRAMLLNVSGAFHSPLMKQAGLDLFDYISDIKTSTPIYPIYMNTTAQKLEVESLKEDMKKHVFSPVLFEQSIKKMADDGFTHFIEVGPGTVLSGLIKKINVNLEVTNLSKVEDLDRVKGWLTAHGFNT